MANPKSSGIGTGAAQVYDYSRIDRAMENAFNVVNRKKEKAQDRQDKLDDEKRKAIAQMQGEFGEYDTIKMKRADVQPLIEMIAESNKELDGNWDKVYNGDPYYSNLYKQQTMLHKKFIGDSMDAKTKFQDLIKMAGEPDSGYSEDRYNQLLEVSTQPGTTWDTAVNEGITSRDQIIGNIFEKVDGAFLDADTALYDEVQKKYTAPDGSSSYRKEKKWLPDNEAKVKFSKTVQASPELMTDMNIKYGDLPEEEKLDAFYNDYKESRIDEKSVTDYSAAQIDDSDSGSGNSAGISSTPFNEKGVEGFTIANPKKALVPITVTIPRTKNKPERTIKIMPDAFVKVKNGWGIRGLTVTKAWSELTEGQKSKYKSESDYYETSSGDLINIPATSNVKAKVRDQYGIGTDWDAHLNTIKGSGGTKGDALGILD